MAKHNELGKKGEELACNLLQETGYFILEKGWRSGQKEIDIIAKHGKLICIVEVKTRETDYHGSPVDAVNISKQKKLIDAAEKYLEQNNLNNELRFDVISIISPYNNPIVEHIEDAFHGLAE